MQSNQATTHQMSDRSYIGANPLYMPMTDKDGEVILDPKTKKPVGYVKVLKGVPFVKVDQE